MEATTSQSLSGKPTMRAPPAAAAPGVAWYAAVAKSCFCWALRCCWMPSRASKVARRLFMAGMIPASSKIQQPYTGAAHVFMKPFLMRGAIQPDGVSEPAKA